MPHVYGGVYPDDPVRHILSVPLKVSGNSPAEHSQRSIFDRATSNRPDPVHFVQRSGQTGDLSPPGEWPIERCLSRRDGTILGIVTEFDIIRGIQAGRSAATTVAEAIMTRDVLTVTPETPLEEVADILERERFVRVPVAERGKLIGIVSRSDVLRYLVEPNFMTFPS